MKEAKAVSVVGSAVGDGLRKIAVNIPAPHFIRHALGRLANNPNVHRHISGAARGVGRHLLPINASTVSDTAADIALGAGTAIVTDRVARHVIKRLHKKDDEEDAKE